MNQHEIRLQQLLHHMDMEAVERIADTCPAGDADAVKARILTRLGHSSLPSTRMSDTQKVAPAPASKGWLYAAAAAACLVLCGGMVGALASGRPSVQKPEPSAASGMTTASLHAEVQPVTEQMMSAETAEAPTEVRSEPAETNPPAHQQTAESIPSEAPLQNATAPQTQVQTSVSGSASVQEHIASPGLGWQVRCRVLTSEVLLESGEIIPQGAVSAEFSHPGHADFDSLVLTLAVVQEGALYTDAEGQLLMQKSAATKHALLAGQLSEDGRTLCIAGASAVSCDGDAALFTLYLKPGTQMTEALFQTLSAEMQTTSPVPPVVNRIPEDTGNDWYVRWHYLAGDADDNTVKTSDGRIDTADAVYILRACMAAPNHELSVVDIDDRAKTWQQYFPAARSAECADANGNTFITAEDAAEVLNYITAAGTGTPYRGFAGTVLVDMALTE